jgi:uncharacterized protein YciI
MTTYYVAFLRPGALWDPEKPAREQAFWDEHARFMDGLFDTGVIVLAGPFADRTGSMVITKAADTAQVWEMFKNDPWTQQDVLSVADVKEWVVFLDAQRATYMKPT